MPPASERAFGPRGTAGPRREAGRAPAPCDRARTRDAELRRTRHRCAARRRSLACSARSRRSPSIRPVTDLFVNGDRGLWIDRGAGAEREPGWTADEAEVRALAVQLIARGGRHIDEATPAVDVRLGARHPRARRAATRLGERHDDLGARATGRRVSRSRRSRGPGWSMRRSAEVLRDAVRCRKNLLVTGAGGTGQDDAARRAARGGTRAGAIGRHRRCRGAPGRSSARGLARSATGEPRGHGSGRARRTAAGGASHATRSTRRRRMSRRRAPRTPRRAQHRARRRRGHAARELARRRTSTSRGTRLHRRSLSRCARPTDGERLRPRAPPRPSRRAAPASREMGRFEQRDDRLVVEAT